MDDLISRQAAVDALHRYFDGMLETDTWSPCDVYGLIEILPSVHPDLSGYSDRLWRNAYERGKAEAQQRWIPCSERLPKKVEGRYWVCTNTDYQCQCRWTDDVYGFGSNGKWAWKIFDIPQYSHVIAWMPLPEPYREGDC